MNRRDVRMRDDSCDAVCVPPARVLDLVKQSLAQTNLPEDEKRRVADRVDAGKSMSLNVRRVSHKEL